MSSGPTDLVTDGFSARVLDEYSHQPSTVQGQGEHDRALSQCKPAAPRAGLVHRPDKHKLPVPSPTA